MHFSALQDIVVIFGLSVLIILIFHKFKMPAIIGLIATGILAGPKALGIAGTHVDIALLAEIGVILLLFVIGMEFSLSSIASIKRAVLLGGSIQVVSTIIFTAFIAFLYNYSIQISIFFGFLISVSSSAIVLKLLQETGAITSPHGKISLAISIFQDIIVVLMMLITPILAGETEEILIPILLLLLKGGIAIAFVLVSAKYIIPKLLYIVAKTKIKELFLLTIIVLCFAVAWLTSEIGLSLALGAFLAGLIISESEYSHQAISNIIPFREIFISFFFISVGMLLDVEYFINHIGLIAIVCLIVIVIKFISISLAVAILKFPARTIILTALSLFQIGEFSFILAGVGLNYQLMNHDTYQVFLAVSILTMSLTPFGIYYSDFFCKFLSKTSIPQLINQTVNPSINEIKPIDTHNLKDHLIIIGFGLTGRNIAMTAKRSNIPYLIIELNPETVKREQANGEPILYGEGVGDTILEHVNIHKARVAVIAISDPNAAKRIVANIRNICHSIQIIVRTRYVSEIEMFYRLGASDVISADFETSIEIFSRVLSKYLVPQHQIRNFIETVRGESYQIYHPLKHFPEKSNVDVLQDLKEFTIVTLEVENEDAPIVNKRIVETKIRSKFRVTLLAIKRNQDYIIEITANTIIKSGDLLFVFGKYDDINAFDEIISIRH